MLWKHMGTGLDAFSSRVLIKASLWKVADTDCVFTVRKKEVLFQSEIQGDHCMLVSLALLI